MPELTFNPDLHEYRIDGDIVPSVTQILSEAGLIDDRWYTDVSRYRGRLIHIITALDDRGILEESAVGDEHQGYLNAWRLFKADTGCEILTIEQRVCNRPYRYAGTMDRQLLWHDTRYVGDIKTGTPEWWHKFQTAGYWECSVAGARCAIYVSADGTYKIRKHENHAYDTGVFRAALVLANAKRNEGKLNGRDRSN